MFTRNRSRSRGRTADRGYLCGGVIFDGANDHMSRGADWTGNADTKLVVVSFWFKIANLPAASAFDTIYSTPADATPKFKISVGDAGGLFVRGRDAAGNLDLSINSSATYNDGAWHHVLLGVNMASFAYLFVDDADNSGTPTRNDDTLDVTQTEHNIGRQTDSAAGWFDGDLADVYVNFGESLDISVEANRRKFISAGLKPVDLGTGGRLPTGSQPILFLHLPRGSNPATFANNRGAGGGMTVTGALTAAASSPTD